MLNRRPRSVLNLFVRPSLVRLEGRDVPTLNGNQLFPADNPWNQNITGAPVASNSAAIISHIVSEHHGTAPGMHPDFGNPSVDGALYGIPVNVVDSRVTPAVAVTISPDGYADESDLVPVPIPATAVIEGDGPTGPNPATDRGDSHLIVYDSHTNFLYELYQATRPTDPTYPDGSSHTDGHWSAFQISVWDLNADTFRTVGDTSADAAGLPILPGLVRHDEASDQGVITHAIRMTVNQTRSAFVYPASHEAGDGPATDLPRMGERFRLRADFVIPSSWSAETKAIAQAMKTYGLIVADNGSDMFFSGAPSNQWDMDAVLQIRAIKATDLEVVDLTPVVTGLSAATGPTAGGTAVTVTGHNFSGAAGQLHVFFGSVEATAVTIQSDSQLVAVAPAEAAGTVNVYVQSGATETDKDGDPVFFGYGTSAVTPADWFTFGTGAPTPPPQSPPPPAPPHSPPPPSVPGSPPPGSSHSTHGVVIGSGVGSQPLAQTLAGADGSATSSGLAFDPAFAGGVRVASADFNGDGVPDLVVGTGPGAPARVRVLDGVDRHELHAADVLEGFTGGVFVAAGDFTGDGVPDVVVTPDQGGGPRVVILSGTDFSTAASFFGIDDPGFRGGARPGVGDMNGDGRPDLIVSAGFGGGPRVAVFDGTTVTGGTRVKLFNDFFVFDPVLRNGAFVAAGDFDGDGRADLVTGAGPGGGPRVIVLSGADLLAGMAGQSRMIANLFAGDPNNRGGVPVAATDFDGDGRADLVTGAGDGAAALVTGYAGANLSAPAFAVDAFPGFTGGVFVG